LAANLYNKSVREWPRNFRNKVKIARAEYIILSGKAYWRRKLIIDLANRKLVFQIIYRAYIIGLGKYSGQTKILDLLNKQYY